MLVEQILAVIQQARVGEPGHAHQPTVDGGVVQLCLEIALGGVGRQHLAQVEQVIGEHAGPDHIDLDDVDIGRLGAENLLIEGQPLGCRIGRRHHLDAVAGLFRPDFDGFLAQLQFGAHGAAGNGQVGRVGECRQAAAEHQQSRGKNRFQSLHKNLVNFYFC
ncbi:hypothetical protein D3C84_503100 [compost metagenome]